MRKGLFLVRGGQVQLLPSFSTSFANNQQQSTNTSLNDTNELENSNSTSLKQSDEVQLHSDPIVCRLMKQYPGKFVPITLPSNTNCEIYLCGTLHVAKSSIDMVQDVIRSLRPEYVVLELCEARIEGLLQQSSNPQHDQNITFQDILRSSWKEKSLRSLGMGLLTWMQAKASRFTGSQLGGELAIACQEAHQLQSTVVLGDRFYGVTIQRLFDHMTLWQKLKMIGCVIWEVLTMTMHTVQDYIHQTQQNVNFVQSEIERFSETFPEVAKVIIHERDDYMAYVLSDLAVHAYGKPPSISNKLTTTASSTTNPLPPKKGKIVSIVGAGHIVGMQKQLLAGKVITEARMKEIATSSKHSCTWEGSGFLSVVDTKKLYQP